MTVTLYISCIFIRYHGDRPLKAHVIALSIWPLWFCLQDEFVRLGGCLHDEEPVTHIQSGSPSVTVTTTKASYTGRHLVLTVGPWTNQMTRPLGLHLPLKVRVITVGCDTCGVVMSRDSRVCLKSDACVVFRS